uniref:RNA helicase n=1 Tax=Palpitomonas bilix TaxID=652834 RepID=A0A7S3GI67_9EUKA|mmetsp:Transcript_50443/g.129962  ORF Transcript_50443/g.129962 Transcript_50443/m.129962 type:complete len:610 (+) Transcript_50443:524-2353(+)
MSSFGGSSFSRGGDDEDDGRPRRRRLDDDDYFNDDDEGPATTAAADKKEEEEEEEDPLDAFMANIEGELEKEKHQPKAAKAERTDIEEKDTLESFVTEVKRKGKATVGESAAASAAAAFDQGDENYNSDDEVYMAARLAAASKDEEGSIVPPRKFVEALPPLDHSTIEYETFNKEFYQECKEIAALSEAEVAMRRRKLDVRIISDGMRGGAGVSRPVQTFSQFNFDQVITRQLEKANYTHPTPIQAQAIPIALSGRDLIGIAKTGSGKTLAFTLPMLVHIMDQRHIRRGEGPIGIVLAPTRELAQQIYSEVKRFAKGFGLLVAAVFGGYAKGDQFKALREGVDIVVATPGRMIDMLKMKACTLWRTTFVVLDEADRMFQMGFEAQVRSVLGHIRPDRQTLLFSATFKRRVETLAMEELHQPVRISIGSAGMANADVHQEAVLLPPHEKWLWLTSKLESFNRDGSTIIFVSKKGNAEELAKNMNAYGHQCIVLHGDKTQIERQEMISKFKKGEAKILVATSVAARGLDVRSVATVVNFDPPRDIEDHVHRIGRTGRAGDRGNAYTLITEEDVKGAGYVVRSMESIGQRPPKEIVQIALQDHHFRQLRERG